MSDTPPKMARRLWQGPRFDELAHVCAFCGEQGYSSCVDPPNLATCDQCWRRDEETLCCAKCHSFDMTDDDRPWVTCIACEESDRE